MEIINHLGNAISIKLKISPAAGRGLIKLAIKDELGPFMPFDKVKFLDLELMIQNSLKKRLVQLDVQNPQELTKFMMKELIENQSLILIYGT